MQTDFDVHFDRVKWVGLFDQSQNDFIWILFILTTIQCLPDCCETGQQTPPSDNNLLSKVQCEYLNS